MSATEFYHKSTASISYWKLAIWKGVNGTLIVGLGAIVAALANENWSQMDAQSKFLFVCGITLSVLKSLDMLLDQTISRLSQKQNQQVQTNPNP